MTKNSEEPKKKEKKGLHGKKEKEIEITCREDVSLLPEPEQLRWEIADELGLFDKVLQDGWRGLTSKESGRIGGIIASRKKKKQK